MKQQNLEFTKADERISKLSAEIEALKTENRDLIRRNAEMSSRIRTFEAQPVISMLSTYADPANWDGDRRFVPVMKHIDADDPYWPARQALNAAGI